MARAPAGHEASRLKHAVRTGRGKALNHAAASPWCMRLYIGLYALNDYTCQGDYVRGGDGRRRSFAWAFSPQRVTLWSTQCHLGPAQRTHPYAYARMQFSGMRHAMPHPLSVSQSVHCASAMLDFPFCLFAQGPPGQEAPSPARKGPRVALMCAPAATPTLPLTQPRAQRSGPSLPAPVPGRAPTLTQRACPPSRVAHAHRKL